MSLLSCHGLSVSINGHRVLSEIDFELNDGECVGLIGPSGEGKSTLLKTLSGLLSPASGEVQYGGVSVAGLPLHRRREIMHDVSMTFQRGGLFDSMTVEENLAFGLCETDRSENYSDVIKNALADVGLEGAQSKNISELSGGMQKRVGLARALVLKPKVMLLDDPTAGLDPVTSRTIIDLLGQVQKKYGTTLVWASSDVPQLLSIVGRVLFLQKGKLQFMGTVDDLRNCADPALQQFVCGELLGPLTETSQ